jgi:hypothetical protein
MERGSDKHGSKLDEQLEDEAESIERSGKEARSEDARAKETAREEPGGSGHRIAGSGSSAEDHSLSDHGEQGGASHPKPKDGG